MNTLRCTAFSLAVAVCAPLHGFQDPPEDQDELIDAAIEWEIHEQQELREAAEAMDRRPGDPITTRFRRSGMMPGQAQEESGEPEPYDPFAARPAEKVSEANDRVPPRDAVEPEITGQIPAAAQGQPEERSPPATETLPGWSIQIGAFKTSERALLKAAEVVGLGAPVYLSEVSTDRGDFILVLLGHFGTRQQAVEGAERMALKERKHDFWIRATDNLNMESITND